VRKGSAFPAISGYIERLRLDDEGGIPSSILRRLHGEASLTALCGGKAATFNWELLVNREAILL
jgi:hypothetical protein